MDTSGRRFILLKSCRIRRRATIRRDETHGVCLLRLPPLGVLWLTPEVLTPEVLTPEPLTPEPLTPEPLTPEPGAAPD